MARRDLGTGRTRWSKAIARAAASCLLFQVALGGDSSASAQAPAPERPNIIFIGAEDISPDLGCYGNALVHTPNLDRLAAQGAIFTRAFTHAPVSAPSRSGMITGMYPTTIGTHNMRSKLLAPPRIFTHELRDAGYYVNWADKTDFNFDPPEDGFDSRERWASDERLQELKAKQQPFFLHINFGVTHESQVFTDARYAAHMEKLEPERRVDPAKVRVPAFYPDAPEVRQDLARYLDLISVLDQQVGELLAMLERNGLEENTLVLFWGDHGRGLPRHKRWCYASGTQIPLIARWPGKIAAGTVRNDLVSVIDFAPTFLTVAGTPIPERMQGQTFLMATGESNPQPRRYVFSARDRMDERHDRIRSVHDGRWQYLRNYHPELPHAQRIQFMENSIIMQTWRRLHAEGELQGAPAAFFAPTKPKEELYDTQADPDEVNNLADSADPQVREKLRELSSALDAWIEQTNDLGAVPETELITRGLIADSLSGYEARKLEAEKKP